MEMELRQLKYFVNVSELGSFTRAAAFLSVAQSALSRQIHNLEEELDTRLLYRTGRGVAVTESGKQLLDHAKTILDQVDRLVDDVARDQEQPSGAVTLGIPPTITMVLVTPLIRNLRTNHPGITLQVVEGFSGFVNEWLANGKLDIAVLYNAPRTRHLQTEKLLTEALYLVGPGGTGSLGQSIPFSEVAKLPLILPSRPHGLRLLIDNYAAQQSKTLIIDCELDSLTAIKELVEEGAGWTILSYASVHREVKSGRLTAQRVVKPKISRDLVLATSTQRPMSRAVNILITQINEEVDQLIESGRWQGARRQARKIPSDA
jgi:LysR family transcriptional regulator, nitrogen assimilation regulatory protein